MGIKPRHLPTCSPNPNLINQAWKVMNEQVRDNVFFPDEKVFVSTIKDCFLNRSSKLSESSTPDSQKTFRSFKTCMLNCDCYSVGYNQQRRNDAAKLRNDFGCPL